VFRAEKLLECQKDIEPVLRHEHWEEVGHYKDIPINMEWDRYSQIESAGKLRCFTIRDFLNEDRKETVLMGYAFFLVDKHLHYRNTLVAAQDILYIRKPYRGIGKDFLKWCHEELKKEKVVTVTQHIKPWFDWGPMAEKLGYEKAETIYTMRLDK
jgi:hypothetical protein